MRRRGWVLGLVAGIGLGASGWGTGADGRGMNRRHGRPAARVVTVRQIVVRREPVVIQAVTLAQLRVELQRARMAHVGYERRIAQQYETIRRLQARLDAQMRAAREAESDRSTQLNAQFETILQAFGLVIFAIIGGLLVALSRARGRDDSSAAPLPPVDWEPLQRQLRDASGTLAAVEIRLRRLEVGVKPGG